MANTDELYSYRYPHPAVTTDCVIITFHEGMLKILLIRRGIEPFKGEWALPGGFLRMDESAEECAHRELREETGVTGCPIKQFHTFSRPDRDPRERVVTIAFYALVKWQEAVGADDAEYADWVPLSKLPPLAFDHAEIIRKAMETIRRDIFFEPVAFNLLNDLFSMPQLQTIYEAILGKRFDRRNFAKKMKHVGILEEATEEEKVKAREALDRDRAITEIRAALAAEASVCAEISATPTIFADFVLPESSQHETCNSINVSEEGDEGSTTLDPEKDHNSFNSFYGFTKSANESLYDLLNDSSIQLEKKQRGRHSSFYRLNRKRYEELKGEDTMEF